LGVGGGGSNAVNRMISMGIEGVDFAVMNTDIQALSISPVAERIQIGEKLTRGYGAGSDPENGRLAAEESALAIAECLGGYDLVFIVAGFGGGTGTGAVPVIARIAKDMNIMTIGIITKPFNFEGEKRYSKSKKDSLY